MKNILITKNLTQLLTANWTRFLDQTQFMRVVLEHARNNEFPEIVQDEIPKQQVKITISKIEITNNNTLSLWTEFTVPKNKGVIIGSQIYSLDLSGNLILQNSFGTILMPKN